MTHPNVSKAYDRLGQALDPECQDPWVHVDEARDLLEEQIDQ